jgi:hypothetical protein
LQSTAEQTTEDRGKKVNLREGTRRLALLLGAVGAIVGGFVSYFELRSVMDQVTRRNRFEQLANSDVVRQQSIAWPLTLRYSPKEAIEVLRRLPEGQQREVLHTLTQEERVDLFARLKCASSQWGVDSTVAIQENLSQVDRWVQYAQNDPYACTAEPIDPRISTVNKGGIKAIHWTKTLGVESIETDDGQILYPTPAPSAWLYLSIALFPALGFFIPWGAVRAIGWVGAGFVASPK